MRWTQSPQRESPALQGRIMFLPPRAKAVAAHPDFVTPPDMAEGAFGHPVVVLCEREDNGKVVCAQMTSFGGLSVEDRHLPDSRAWEYAPIFPAVHHLPTDTLYLDGGKALRKKSYVNLVELLELPLKVLVPLSPPEEFYLEEQSFGRLVNAIYRRTGDPRLCDLVTDATRDACMMQRRELNQARLQQLLWDTILDRAPETVVMTATTSRTGQVGQEPPPEMDLGPHDVVVSLVKNRQKTVLTSTAPRTTQQVGAPRQWHQAVIDDLDAGPVKDGSTVATVMTPSPTWQACKPRRQLHRAFSHPLATYAAKDRPMITAATTTASPTKQVSESRQLVTEAFHERLMITTTTKKMKMTATAVASLTWQASSTEQALEQPRHLATDTVKRRLEMIITTITTTTTASSRSQQVWRIFVRHEARNQPIRNGIARDERVHPQNHVTTATPEDQETGPHETISNEPLPSPVHNNPHTPTSSISIQSFDVYNPPEPSPGRRLPPVAHGHDDSPFAVGGEAGDSNWWASIIWEMAKALIPLLALVHIHYKGRAKLLGWAAGALSMTLSSSRKLVWWLWYTAQLAVQTARDWVGLLFVA